MRQKGLLLTDGEKKWYKQRARVWGKGRKKARDDIKAFKERALASTSPLKLAAYKPDRPLMTSTGVSLRQRRQMIGTSTMVLRCLQ